MIHRKTEKCRQKGLTFCNRFDKTEPKWKKEKSKLITKQTHQIEFRLQIKLVVFIFKVSLVIPIIIILLIQWFDAVRWKFVKRERYHLRAKTNHITPKTINWWSFTDSHNRYFVYERVYVSAFIWHVKEATDFN